VRETPAVCPSWMDTSGQLVAAAFSRMQERDGSDRAPADACSSSRVGVSWRRWRRPLLLNKRSSQATFARHAPGTERRASGDELRLRALTLQGDRPRRGRGRRRSARGADRLGHKTPQKATRRRGRRRGTGRCVAPKMSDAAPLRGKSQRYLGDRCVRSVRMPVPRAERRGGGSGSRSRAAVRWPCTRRRGVGHRVR